MSTEVQQAAPLSGAALLKEKHRSLFNRHTRVQLSNRLFKHLFFVSILLLCLVLGLVIFFIGKTGILLFRDVSFATFFFSMNWSPEEEQYGALLFILNTLVLTGITLLIAVPISVGMALLIVEIAPSWLKRFIRPVLDLLVGIPSIVYGYLGLTVLVPMLREWSGEGLGDGVLAAALVLALMILPTITRVSDEAIASVPQKYREAAYALGSTRLQVMMRVVLPAASRGVIAAIILGMTRAIGETMAVVMVIGNTAQLATDLFMPTSVLTSNIVMQISNVEFESTWNYALHMMAFLLLIISFILIVIIRILGRKRGSEA